MVLTPAADRLAFLYRWIGEEAEHQSRLRTAASSVPLGSGAAGAEIDSLWNHLRRADRGDVATLTDEQRAQHDHLDEQLALSSSSLLDSAAAGMGIVSGHRTRLDHISAVAFGLLGSLKTTSSV